MSHINKGIGGTWWLYSKTDPQWNCEGTTELCGGLVMPLGCKRKLESLKKQYGEPPKDLE